MFGDAAVLCDDIVVVQHLDLSQTLSLLSLRTNACQFSAPQALNLLILLASPAVTAASNTCELITLREVPESKKCHRNVKQ